MAKVIHIPANRGEPMKLVDASDYRDRQKLVGGLMTTAAHDPKVIVDGTYAVSLMANDEGIIKGLPFNPRAVAWARPYYDEAHLFGDCFVMRTDEEGEAVDVTDGDIGRTQQLCDALVVRG